MQPIEYYRRWQFKNLTVLCLSLLLLIYLADHPVVSRAIGSMEALGYVGVFITGMFFVSTFTVAPAAVVLFRLAEQFPLVPLALTAGLGAMVGDYLIFRFFKDGVFEELKYLYQSVHPHYPPAIEGALNKLAATPYFGWLTPMLGALIIASPFPDEIGIGLMGLSKVGNWQFLLISYFLNTAGIFAVVGLGEIF